MMVMMMIDIDVVLCVFFETHTWLGTISMTLGSQAGCFKHPFVSHFFNIDHIDFFMV
jgi:hypothetical protein